MLFLSSCQDFLQYDQRMLDEIKPSLLELCCFGSSCFITTGWTDEVREVLKHGTLSVGFIGLAETLVALTGKHHGESEHSQRLGLEIIARMRARMDAESQKTGLNFSLLATPAEGLSGRFIRIDKQKFGIIPGVTDRDYYTNSFHVPVYYPVSAFEKIKLEAPYHALTNAGDRKSVV